MTITSTKKMATAVSPSVSPPVGGTRPRPKVLGSAHLSRLVKLSSVDSKFVLLLSLTQTCIVRYSYY